MSGHRTIMSGLAGGGFLLAGFGPLGAILGMVLGALAGWAVERRLEALSPDQPGRGAASEGEG